MISTICCFIADFSITTHWNQKNLTIWLTYLTVDHFVWNSMDQLKTFETSQETSRTISLKQTFHGFESPRRIANLLVLSFIEQQDQVVHCRQRADIMMTDFVMQEKQQEKAIRVIEGVLWSTAVLFCSLNWSIHFSEHWRRADGRNLQLTNDELEDLLEEVTRGKDLAHLANSLWEVNLSQNFLERFPECLLGLRSAERIIMGYNNIRTIPENIHTMANIKHLDLSHNRITKIPPELCQLSNLVYLSVRSFSKRWLRILHSWVGICWILCRQKCGN